MTFDRPALLVLAALAAVLPWLLGRIRDRRVRVPVGTLLLHERALEILAARRAAEPRAVERKRLVDPRLVAETIALAALALAAAGPRLEGARPAARYGVVRDSSASMRADGVFRLIEDALRERAEVVEASTSDAPAGVTDAARWVDGALRARGVDATLLVTDHPPSDRCADGVIVLAFHRGPNHGIVAAGARGREVLVRADAAEVVIGVLTRDGGLPVLEGPGPVLRGEIPEALARAPLVAMIGLRGSTGRGMTMYEDAFAADDSVLLEPPGAPIRVAIIGPTATALPRALEAAGGVVAARRDAEAEIRLAAGPGEGPPPERLFETPAPWMRHADLAAMSVRVAPAPLPGPASGSLGPAWRPVLVDDRGRMIVGVMGDGGRPRTLGIAIPLEGAATDWTTRRSFPVFLAEWLDAVAGDARGEWRAIGLLDARETEEAKPLPADALRSLDGHTVALTEIRALDSCLAALPHLEAAASRSPRRAALAAASTTSLAPVLLLAGALAVLASWALTRDRRLGRVAASAV